MDRLTQKELDCLLALREMKLAGQSQTATAPGTDNHADQGDSNQPHHMADKEAIQPIAHQGDHDRSQPGSNTSSTPSAATSQTKTKATKTESNQVKWKVPQWIIDEQNSTADFFLRMYEVNLFQQSKKRLCPTCRRPRYKGRDRSGEEEEEAEEEEGLNGRDCYGSWQMYLWWWINFGSDEDDWE